MLFLDHDELASIVALLVPPKGCMLSREVDPDHVCAPEEWMLTPLTPEVIRAFYRFVHGIRPAVSEQLGETNVP